MNKPKENSRPFLKPLVCLLIALFSATVPAQDEDAIKIGYLYNFSKFVEWPASIENEPGKPWNLCVLGDEIVKTVASILEGKRVRQKAIVVVNAKRGSDLDGCQVAFVSASEGWRVGPMLKALEDRPTLTVSDAEDFAAQGGMIGLVREGDKIRFEINLGAAEKAGLKISAQLAKLAMKTYGKVE
jgi:hypothetical protein